MNPGSDGTNKQVWVSVVLFDFFSKPMNFLLRPAHVLEMMVSLTIVACLSICGAFLCTVSCSLISAIKHHGWQVFYLVVWRLLLEDWLLFSFPIPCTDESLSSSWSCFSVTSAGLTMSRASSRVSSCTLSNLSLVLPLFTPSTIRSLMSEFFSVHEFTHFT